jgi:hypothetical protein
MRAMLTLLVVFLLAASYDPDMRYFSRRRDVMHVAPDQQNYFVVDSDVWQFARPDLADVRLYAGALQVPFVISKQSSGSSHHEAVAQILNLGTVDGHTEFDIDVRGIREYSRVRLNLDAKNFICPTHIQGRDDMHKNSGAELGTSTLYDFTSEGLGSSFLVKFPASNFPYLHVRLAPGIVPAQIKGAYVASFSETKAAWVTVGTCVAVSGQAEQSVFECCLSAGMPVERFVFHIDPGAVNFNRAVIVSDATGGELDRGSINRVRLTRDGQSVTSESLAVDTYRRSQTKIRVIVQNHDDQPLPIQQVEALAVERRIYFESGGNTALGLYYGDQKLGAPSYDYAKFFQPNPDAAIAQLGEPEANAVYTGRPDDRPWSERHKSLLWLAMLIVVAALGIVAVRGFVVYKETQH